ncbi:MAG TPA: phage holin family protein [Candidatus Binatia bacterium]
MRPSGQPRDSGDFGPGRNDASATEAVERVLDAGQRLVSERIELARLDVEEALAGRVARAALVVVPALFAFGGWWLLMAAAVTWLDAYTTRATGLAIVGGANVVLGLALVLTGWRSAWAPAATNGHGAHR